MEEKNLTRGSSFSSALVLALAILGAAGVLASAAVRIAQSRATITVTGSAKRQIRSDLVIWRGTFYALSPQMQTAYAELKSEGARVRDHLMRKGIPEGELIFSSIATRAFTASGPKGEATTKITGYRLSQDVEIRSTDVDRITTISREATELIHQGIEFESYAPQFFYTKLADLKVEMLALATRDAKARAQEVAKNTGSSVGKLRSARMGVFQITPAYSNTVENYGMNDDSSLLKDITAVVEVSFEIR